MTARASLRVDPVASDIAVVLTAGAMIDAVLVGDDDCSAMPTTVVAAGGPAHSSERSWVSEALLSHSA